MMTFEEEYDILFKKIDDFMLRVNPCSVKDGKCLRAQMGGSNFCCGSSERYKKCSHCSSNGCNAEKPLGCRAWLCKEAENSFTPEQAKEYRRIKLEIIDFLFDNGNDLDYFRKDKHDIVSSHYEKQLMVS